VSPRPTNTRQRIQDVALELFAERGYDKTSLREIADQLGVTKAALYYHFRAKEDILVAIVEDFGRAIDELAAWSAEQPRSYEANREILSRLAELVRGRWRPVVRFLQENQPALRDLGIGELLADRMRALFTLLVRPGDDLHDHVVASLAALAVYFGNLPAEASSMIIGLSAPEDQIAASAMDVALELSDRLAAPRLPR
jgi:AcrR family transcriptional regulator